MMARLRYRAMYVMSCTVGYVLGLVLVAGGQRFSPPLRTLVRRTARQHAIDAARKRGPYLAPVTFVAGLLGVILLIALLAGCKPAPGCGAACVPNPDASAAVR